MKGSARLEGQQFHQIRSPRVSPGVVDNGPEAKPDLEAPELEITRLLEPGDWELWVKVIYQKGAPVSDVWEGVIVSNPVSIKVVETNMEKVSV